jgi:hypothetical protein
MSTHALGHGRSRSSSSHARYVGALVIARSLAWGFCLGVLPGPEITCEHGRALPARASSPDYLHVRGSYDRMHALFELAAGKPAWKRMWLCHRHGKLAPRPWRPIEPAAFWSHVSVQSVSGGSDIPLAVFPLFYREPAPLPTHVRPRIPACIYGAALDWRTSYTALCLRFGGMEFRQTSRELRLFWPACSLRVRRRESKYSHALGPVSM